MLIHYGKLTTGAHGPDIVQSVTSAKLEMISSTGHTMEAATTWESRTMAGMHVTKLDIHATSSYSSQHQTRRFATPLRRLTTATKVKPETAYFKDTDLPRNASVLAMNIELPSARTVSSSLTNKIFDNGEYLDTLQ